MLIFLMAHTQHNDNSNLNVLVLEPYYGGSHKSFIDGLKKLPFNLECLTLPARNWKWRMRLAAPYFADELRKSGRQFDRVLCSSYLDVAAFRGLAPAWIREVPLLTYFHENQFEYPVQIDDKRDLHFALTNVTTAMASDSLAFNSGYNLSSFLSGMENLLKHSTDMTLENQYEIVRLKSIVLPPGIDFSTIDSANVLQHKDTPVILWNHRWEHDKNPGLFFETLFELDEEGIDFSLVVLGQSFKNIPTVFEEAEKKLAHRILHYGYVRSKQDYARWLRKCDIVVSTALHEFFGISVLEAVRAGCRPLLPRRLVYPELFPDIYLYDDTELTHRLKKEILRNERLTNKQAVKLTAPYSWGNLSPEYKSWIIEPLSL